MKLIFHGHNNGYTVSKRSNNLYTTVFIEDKTVFQLIGVVYILRHIGTLKNN